MYPDYYSMYNQYYGIFEEDCRNNEQSDSDEIITFNQAIELIKQSVSDEREDEMFYDGLIQQAPTKKEKDILRNIRNDERKHNQILRRLYYEFTGETLPIDDVLRQSKNNMNYKANLEKALFGELNAVTKYRKILGVMPSGNSYTLLMAIMTDELRHAIQYNFLIQENNHSI